MSEIIKSNFLSEKKDFSNLKIVKTYPKKGKLSLFRFEISYAFKCFRCNQEKKSRLHSIFNDNWSIKLCNGCYGRLLSLYDNYEDIILEDEKIIHEKIIRKDYSAEDKIITTKSRGSMQKIFATIVKNNYANKCAVTGISSRALLIGAHIIPWSEDEEKRMDPSNGICFSILIEKCFDRGMLTINPDYELSISKNVETDKILYDYLNVFKNKKILLPKENEFFPSIKYLEEHWKKFHFFF